MSNVVELSVVTTLDLPVERILDKAREAGLTDVVVIGYGPDGERYFASSNSDGGEVLWLLEKAKRDLLAIGEDDRA